MKMDAVLQELERAAQSLAVKVQYDVLTESVGGGGLCKVKGAYRVIIERRGTPAEKAVTLARALAGVPGMEGVELGPDARDLVEKNRRAA